MRKRVALGIDVGEFHFPVSEHEPHSQYRLIAIEFDCRQDQRAPGVAMMAAESGKIHLGQLELLDWNSEQQDVVVRLSAEPELLLECSVVKRLKILD